MNRKIAVAAFTLFIAAGAVPARADMTKAARDAQTEADKETEKLAKDLQLNPEQQLQVRDVMRAAYEQRRNILDQARDSIRGQLTPIQQQRFDEMRKKN